MVKAWILDEDAERRATAALALELAGYQDFVAFEDAQQLLAYRRSAPPALAVIDARTARFDASEIHRALTGVPLVVVVADDEHAEPWRSLGVTLLLRRPTSAWAPSVGGFGMHEGRSGTRTVPPELRAGSVTVKRAAGERPYVTRGLEARAGVPSPNSLKELLASLGQSMP